MAISDKHAALLAGAQMITGACDNDDQAIDLAYAAKLDAPAATVAEAKLVASALGLWEARINGKPVDNSVLNPGWTAYEWRVQVKEVDVTELVRESDDLKIDVLLGDGWYRGKFGFERQRSDYGSKIGFIGALQVSYTDGTSQIVSTSTDWTASKSQVVFNNLYDGETIDYTVEPGAEAYETEVVDFDRNVLIDQEGPDAIRHEVVHAQKIWTSPSGKTLVDFGQNIVGWLRFTVKGERGSEIVIRHAEVIEREELGTRPLREAKATDRLILSGGEDFFEPTLTFHGFRYVEVTGWPGELAPSDLEAVVVHSDIKRTGWFSCSNADVNQLVHNSVWSQKDNFLDVPTDCPQRDEREGWTGDLAQYSPTAVFQFDCRQFLHKWLMDLKAETEHNEIGIVPMVVPDVVKLDCPENVSGWVKNATAIWGDASVWVPQALWNAYGDVEALAEYYPAMKMHVASIERDLTPEGLWNKGFQFGDWLDPIAPPDDPADAAADRYVIAQSCLYRTASFVAEVAGILGHVDEQKHYEDLAARVRKAYNDAYVNDGVVKSDAVAAYTLALHFGLLDEEDAKKAAARLAELVREQGYKVMTGFAGTPYVTWALSENGYIEDAYKMLLERECPSWLYPITMGATTVWERWDSMLPNGLINPGGMTSFNHYALGAVCDWVYQVIGGIRAEEPGYAKVRIQPVPGEGISWASCAYNSVHGRIDSSWHVQDGRFDLSVSVPEGIPAVVVLPNGDIYEVTGGTHHFGCDL